MLKTSITNGIEGTRCSLCYQDAITQISGNSSPRDPCVKGCKVCRYNVAMHDTTRKNAFPQYTLCSLLSSYRVCSKANEQMIFSNLPRTRMIANVSSKKIHMQVIILASNLTEISLLMLSHHHHHAHRRSYPHVERNKRTDAFYPKVRCIPCTSTEELKSPRQWIQLC